jgi:hypothetical protein
MNKHALRVVGRASGRGAISIKTAMAVAILFGVGVVVKILFFQKYYWYEARGDQSRIPVGAYTLVADVSAGSGHMSSAMVNLSIRHRSEVDRGADEPALVEISIPCEAVKLEADGVVVKPADPATCRSGAGQTNPQAYLDFTLPSAEPQKITLNLPAIDIRARNGEITISPPVSIEYYEQRKYVSATFH